MEDENKEEKKVDTQTTTDNQEQKTDKQSVSETFGNEKSEKKDEGGKNSETFEKKEDGSLTFKNQEELEGFIGKIFKRGAKKGEEQEEIDINSETEEEKSNKTDASTEEVKETPDYTANIALAMVEADINPQKARRASRLIDTNKVIENGVLNETKLKEEIEAIIAEFPELKNSTVSEENSKGFKFGSEGSNNEEQEKTQKETPKKRWNKFN